VIFENIEFAVAVTDQVGPRNVAPHAPRRLESRTRVEKALGRVEQLLGYDAVFDDDRLAVGVVDEEVEGRDSLLEPALDAVPFFELDDARDDVEGPDLLGPGGMAVDAEGDPHVEE